MPDSLGNRSLRILAVMTLAAMSIAYTAIGQENDALPANNGLILQWSADQASAGSPPQRPPQVDHQIIAAEHTEPAEAAAPLAELQIEVPPIEPDRPTNSSRLAPPSGARPLDLRGKRLKDGSLPFAIPQMDSLTTAGAGLAVVVGLFLLCAWLFRRSGPKATSPLPQDAAAVLGRIPLAGNHFAHLLKLGNKLVLVAVSPESVTPLAEVTDPNEVQHLLSLCLRGSQNSTSAEFQQVLQQLANEPAKGFLEGTPASTTYARPGRS